MLRNKFMYYKRKDSDEYRKLLGLAQNKRFVYFLNRMLQKIYSKRTLPCTNGTAIRLVGSTPKSEQIGARPQRFDSRHFAYKL